MSYFGGKGYEGSQASMRLELVGSARPVFIDWLTGHTLNIPKYFNPFQ